MPQQFGASHTEEKLDKLEAYLKVFTTALKHQRFRLVYLDTFAGTPEIDVGATKSPLLFDDFRPFLQGSSRRALRFGRAFDAYIFVDRRKQNIAELISLREEFPDLVERIDIRHADANGELQKFCSKWPIGQRAVVFLDPYGNQVEWKTIEAIARTKAIDLWYLFPAGLGVHRQISGDGTVHWTACSARPSGGPLSSKNKKSPIYLQASERNS
jgi:three-Cys-motif partner protein